MLYGLFASGTRYGKARPPRAIFVRPPALPTHATDRRGETGQCLKDTGMEETMIDRAAMGRLAKALAFICGQDHPTTSALGAAAESGSEKDIKKARTLFLRLKSGDRRAALTMIAD